MMYIDVFYKHIYRYVCIYIYIYIYREREIERSTYVARSSTEPPIGAAERGCSKQSVLRKAVSRGFPTLQSLDGSSEPTLRMALPQKLA